ncbi:MAG: hypothetical protein ABI402_18040, partial [Ferruginibacter sp.]
MNQHLQKILDFIQQDEKLTAEEKAMLAKAAKSTDSDLSISEFKLDRTEKVKRTTAILLEETIEELEQKRKAVETQNRDLEIEASLERVRTVAMGMNNRDDMMSVCHAISQQLQILNVKEIRNVQTAIFYKEKGSYMNYEYYTKHDKTFITETNYTNHEIARAFAEKMNKGKGEVSVTLIDGEEKVKEWLNYQKGTNVFIDTFLETASSVNYYWFSLGPVALGISTYIALNENELNLFKRFLNVFEMAYRRFLDIEKAEAQAKEARIETALERVRAVAMAMHKPADLLDICKVLFEELEALGFTELRNAMINIHDDDKESFLNYDYSDFAGAVIANVRYDIYPSIATLVNESRSADDAFIEYIYSGKKLDDWKKFRKDNGEYDDPRVEKTNTLCYYFYSIAVGSIGISAFSPIGEERLEVLKRFRNVFNLSYQRYADISLAEAQTREAQIQLALERVRARTMAMQNSNELAETSAVLFQQIKALGFDTWSCGFFIWQKNDMVEAWMGADTGSLLPPMMIPHKKEPTHKEIYKSKQAGASSHEKIWNGKALEKHYAFLRTIPSVANAIDQLEEAGLSMPKQQCYYAGFFNLGYLLLITKEPNVALAELSKRFAKTFEQTYTRFLDLQKAEAQVREAKIEAALEKVRSRSMGMQKSQELTEVIKIVYQQLNLLEINLDHAGFVVDYEAKADWHFWIADEHDIPSKITHPYFESVWANQFNEAKENGADFFATNLNYEEKNKFYSELLSYVPGLSQASMDFYLSCPGLAISTVLFDHVSLYMENFSGISYSDEENKILMRFGKVFEQTYTRFLDLQKAEAQAREATIEAALERVRSKTMAMHNSEDVGDTVATLFEEFIKLGIDTFRCGIGIIHEERKMEVWTAKRDPNGNVKFFSGYMDMSMHPMLQGAYLGWKKKQETYVYDLKDSDLEEYFTYINNNPKYPLKYDIQSLPPGLIFSIFNFPEGFLFAFTLEKLSIEATKIFKRFSGVFGQTYRRYLDLQKAEAQAREAKIEAALERTRTQSMIMQHSKELDDTLRVFHEQVQLLGINSAFSFLWLPDEEKDKHIFWAIWEERNNDVPIFKNKAINYPLDRNEPATKQCLIDWKGNEQVVSYAVPPEGVKNYFAAWQELIDGVETLRPEHFSKGLYYVEAFMKYGCFGVLAENDLKEDEKKILGRIANEFERTYTRFLDLQKAEAQAREAQIEAALEKVRSRTMAMQRSDELSGTAALLFQEFKKLEQQELIQITIGIYNEAKNEMEFRATDWKGGGEQIDSPAYGSMNEPTLLNPAVTAWRAHAKSLIVDLTGKALEGWLSYRNKMTGTPISSKDAGDRRVVSIAFFSKGHLSLSSLLPLPADTVKTLERFAAVFDGTYTRFLDLQKVEAQAKESQIEVALERVRSRTLAMQKSDELAETAAVLFKQLIHLGIAPNRLYIAIIEDKNGYTDFWITDEDGSKISSAFQTNLNDNPTFRKMFDGWNQDIKSLTIDMQGAELQEYFKYLESINVPFKGGLSQKRRLQHLAYFSKGFIGMASPDDQPVETILLLERFAGVFNLTFTRFNDLQVAEAHAIQAEEDLIKLQTEKKRAEDALTNLQAAQKQLVQSEKMASLGELTAGIAHEIQNPLNFVNNFSEVSVELMKEMLDEAEKGNTEEVKAIVYDIIQNLEKINHHGKRADAIVKGMLQHSQSSTGQKQLTDINVLTDEYIRLCYHGLRAKDKSFNATIKTDFDKSIEKINIIPQDIGRVILNL